MGRLLELPEPGTPSQSKDRLLVDMYLNEGDPNAERLRSGYIYLCPVLCARWTRAKHELHSVFHGRSYSYTAKTAGAKERLLARGTHAGA